jgi:hypothetical protein
MDEMKGELGHGWPMLPFTFTSIDYLKIKRDLGVTSDRCEASQREEVEAWMPTGDCFMDEYLHVIKLNCQPLFGCRRQRDEKSTCRQLSRPTKNFIGYTNKKADFRRLFQFLYF